MGMVNFGKFFTTSGRENTLIDLLRVWGSHQQDAFGKIKEELTTLPSLVLYDTNKDRVVSADASSYGLGAVLLQKQEYNIWKPMAHASKTLNNTEQRYAQIEKEALASTWAST